MTVGSQAIVNLLASVAVAARVLVTKCCWTAQSVMIDDVVKPVCPSKPASPLHV